MLFPFILIIVCLVSFFFLISFSRILSIILMFLQHTPVFFPGKFHGQRSLAGYSSWGHKESNTTEQLSMLMFLRILLSGSIKICSNFKYVYYTSKIILWKNETKEFWTQDSKWWLLKCLFHTIPEYIKLSLESFIQCFIMRRKNNMDKIV